MSPELLAPIAAFARVAHHASFTRAAAELGASPSALSQTVRKLESSLGVRLLDRSTRRVGVTELGQRFLTQAHSGLASLAHAIDGLNESRDKPAGLLRLNLSRTAADVVVMPYLTDFLEAFPEITLKMHCDNALLDLVGGGFDSGIRLGENLAQDVVAVPWAGGTASHRIASHRIATVASPLYLKGRTLPQVPQDLADHRCLNVRLGGGIYRWEYMHKGREVEIEVHGPLISNDGDTLLAAVRAGTGIACTFEVQVQDDIAAGRLVPLLKPWWPIFPGFYLYHPSRQHIPRKLREFIDFMQARLTR